MNALNPEPITEDDDNDDAIVGTILSRRAVLRSAARASLGLGLGALLLKDADAAYQLQARKTVKLIASPAVTEGPFFVDEKLRRTDLRTGTNRAAVISGVPLDLTLQLYRLTNGKFAPLKNATVDVWHADAHGVYSDQSNPMNHEDTAGQKWLRGYQVSDASGLVHFKTIIPGWYESRTTHIHFKIRQPASGKATQEFTSQLFFDDNVADKIFAQSPYRARGTRQVRNHNDSVYTERQRDGSKAGDHMMLALAPATHGRGYTSTLAIALTSDNLRSGNGRHGFGGPGGPPPGGFGGPPPGGFGGPGGPPPGFGPDDF